MITTDFTSETKTGLLLHWHIEGLYFDDVMEVLEKVIDWCEERGFKMKRCDINDIKLEVTPA